MELEERRLVPVLASFPASLPGALQHLRGWNRNGNHLVWTSDEFTMGSSTQYIRQDIEIIELYCTSTILL